MKNIENYDTSVTEIGRRFTNNHDLRFKSIK